MRCAQILGRLHKQSWLIWRPPIWLQLFLLWPRMWMWWREPWKPSWTVEQPLHMGAVHWRQQNRDAQAPDGFLFLPTQAWAAYFSPGSFYMRKKHVSYLNYCYFDIFCYNLPNLILINTAGLIITIVQLFKFRQNRWTCIWHSLMSYMLETFKILNMPKN